MPCYSPFHAYEGKVNVETGKVSTVWRRDQSPEQVKRVFPCFQCVGCRLERSRQWALRCMDEASLFDKNCFVTLTYDDAHLPGNRSLDVSVFQGFMKRLRKKFGPGIRFYHSGEYGDKFRRPHYHALLFNHDFLDKRLFTVRNGISLFTSRDLGSLWDKGYSSVGEVTFESAAYVARYVMKKINGDMKEDHYVDKVTGEILKPEYSTMSRRPGIGAKWFHQFASDVYPSDEKVYNGRRCRPPKFYDYLLDKIDPQCLDEVKQRRIENSPDWFEVSDVRLRVKEEVKLAQIKSLIRPLEV